MASNSLVTRDSGSAKSCPLSSASRIWRFNFMRETDTYSLAILPETSSRSLASVSAPSVLANSSLSSGLIALATSFTLTAKTASCPASFFSG